MGDFRELTVWRAAQDLARRVYRLTAAFPPREEPGLARQLRRAAVSIPSNVAEGAGRSLREFGRYVEIARGSAAELRSGLMLARDLEFLGQADWAACDPQVDQVSRILAGLRAHLRHRRSGMREGAGDPPAP